MLTTAIENGLVDTSVAFIDGTHIKANANTHENYKKLVGKEARSCDERLKKELDEDRAEHGKKPLADAGYKTPCIAKLLLDGKTAPYMPYRRSKTKKWVFL